MLSYKTFESELKLIKHNKIKQFTVDVLFALPNYFYEVPASSTGKYHPGFAQSTGGLVKHTKAAVHIAHSLFATGLFKLSDIDKDIVISTLLIHDGAKHGFNGSKWTVKSHPQKLVKFIKDRTYIKCPQLYKKKILEAVRLHMGKWNVKNYDRPKTTIQKFVHLCDYIASRKWINKLILKTLK